MAPKIITTAPFAGFAIGAAEEGQEVRILRRASLTADDPRFYMFVNQIDDDFLTKAGIVGDSITKFFIVQRPDKTAEVYTEYGIIIEAQVNRDLKKGEPVYLADLSDIHAFKVEDIEITPGDVVICVMKVGWKYGLYFDATRNISEDELWKRLGYLYRTLSVERAISVIQERIQKSRQPHLITEGKTDWRHIEAARRALKIDFTLGYPATDDSLGDSALLQICERLGKFGPRQANKVIAVFDRDNRQILTKLERQGGLDGFQRWGNNVYSLALPVPAHRVDYKNISIEFLYSDDDFRTSTDDGKRAYFDNELRTEVTPGAGVRHVPIPAVATMEFGKKVFDGEAGLIVNEDGKQVGLSKGHFAELVYKGEAPFADLDMSSFTPVFETIRQIMSDHESQ